MNKVKVVFVLPDLVSGGAERVMSYIANNISKEQFDTSLWLAGHKKDSAYTVDSIEVKYFNKQRILTALPDFFKSLRKQKPDIVISSISHVNTAMAVLSIFFPKTKFIGREANVLSVYKNHNKKTGRMGGLIPLNFSYKFLDLVLCQSEDMYNDMKDSFNIPENKLRVINNPVTDGFKLKPESYDPDKEIKFITVARLKKQKGHERVIRALAKVDFPFHYTIIGDGPEKEFLFSLIEELGISDKVTHIPFTREVPKYLSQSDLYLQGSFVEGFPNAIIESCMVGTPVLAIDAPGGINEIIYNGINGYVVPNQDTYLEYLNKINTDYVFTPSEVSETIKSRYSSEIILNKYKDLFFRSSKIDMIEKKNLSILSFNLTFGGAQRVISLLLKYLVKDYNVSLVLFYDIIDFDIPDGVHVEILLPKDNSKNALLRKVKETYLVSKKYNNFIRNNNIDISMAFLALPNIINGMVAKKNKNLRTVISERCFPSIMYKANRSSQFIADYLIPMYYNKNDALFSNSININKDLKENFKVNIPMSVIYNPINVDENIRILPESITSEKVLNFINVGSIYEAKNQKMIVNAMNLLNKGDYHYTQAGSGVMEEEIKTLTKELGLTDHATYLGNINNVKDFLLKSDCFVLSSNTEGFPNVVLEALACGLPVISTNCMTGPLELLNDNEPVDIQTGEFVKAKYGLLVNVDDSAGLAKALTYFKEYPEARKKYSEVGFERAKQNEMPNIYKQVKELLNA